MAQQYDPKTRKQINAQLKGVEASRSLAKGASVVATEGLDMKSAAELVVEAVERVLATRTDHLSHLMLSRITHKELETLLDPTISLSVGAIAVASLPLAGSAWMSKFTSVARHHVVVAVIDRDRTVKKYSLIPFRSVFEHNCGAVVLEFNTDGKLWMSLTSAEFTECTYGLSRGGPTGSFTDERLERFLSSKGMRPEDTCDYQRPFRKLYEWARRFVLENDYDLDTTNCKAFARTVFRSYRVSQYSFVNDAGKDKWHKWAAHKLGGRSVVKMKGITGAGSADVATPFLSHGNISIYSPGDLKEADGAMSRPGPSGRVVPFMMWMEGGHLKLKAENLSFGVALPVFRADGADEAIMSGPLRAWAETGSQRWTAVRCYLALGADEVNDVFMYMKDAADLHPDYSFSLGTCAGWRMANMKMSGRSDEMDARSVPLQEVRGLLWYSVFT